MGTIWEQLQQLNIEVKEKDSKLEDAVKELRKNPTDTIMLGERDRLVEALEGLNARRATLEEKLPSARSGLVEAGELLQRILDNQRVMSGIVLVDLKETFRPPSTGKESRGSNTGFRERIMKIYGMGDLPKCMVLCKELPGEFLVAGHLYAVRWKRYASVIMGSSFDVNSARNGIIWCSAIDHEYERQRICFSYRGPGSEFILHVLDKSLLSVKLSSVGQHKNNPAFEAALGDVTFGDLQCKHVTFAGANGMGPFKRALAMHAKFALELCAKTYPDDFDPKNYNFDDKSDYECKQAFVHMWLGQLDTGSMAEGNEEEDEEDVEVDV